MSFAPQRFDSLQKPLGKLVINLEAPVSYCHVVVRDRAATSEAGQGCVACLMLMTEENVILLGMMADASDECLIPSRGMHRGMVDIGSARLGLQQIHNRINNVFAHKGFRQTG